MKPQRARGTHDRERNKQTKKRPLKKGRGEK
jgi:hypothetical protein